MRHNPESADACSCHQHEQTVSRAGDPTNPDIASIVSTEKHKFTKDDHHRGSGTDRAGTDGGPSGGVTCRDVWDMPPVVDVVTAGRVLGIGRTKAYHLARTGTFPCTVIHTGRTYMVPTAALTTLLGLDRPCTCHHKETPST